MAVFSLTLFLKRTFLAFLDKGQLARGDNLAIPVFVLLAQECVGGKILLNMSKLDS